MLEKLVNGQDAFLFQPTSGKLFWLPNIRLSNKVNNERGKPKQFRSRHRTVSQIDVLLYLL